MKSQRPQNKNLLSGGKPGKHKPGAGRPADWLKEKCVEILDKKKLIEYLGRVASGEELETRIVFDDDNVPHHEKVESATKDRLRAIDMLLDRGFGKAIQGIEHSGSIDIGAEKAKQIVKEETRLYLSEVTHGA